MKHYLLIIFVFLLNIPVGNAQDANHVLEDFSSLSEKNQTVERVDTLVKYIRKEFYKNNYGNTISVGEETLKLAKQLGDQKAVFRISSLLGNAFLQLDDTLQARRIFYRTLQDAKRLNDTTRSLTTARIDLGNYYALQEKNDLAIYQYEHAIPLARKLKDTTHLFILNYNIAELYLDQENIFEASHYVNQVDLLVKGVKAEAYQAVASLVKGRLHFLKNEPEAAIVYLAESVRLAEKSGYNDALIEAYEVYAKAEMALENYESAAELLLKADEYKSEKYKTDKIKALEKVTAKFKINQYEQELAAQSMQNEINQQQAKRDTTVLWIKIASGILLLFSIILLISYIKRRRLMNDLVIKNEKYLEAKELSEAQVEAKSKLFSNITHELRTPMYGIIGISSLLQDDPRLYHQNENLNSLKFSADYLLSLINNVLQFNKMNSTHEKLKRSEFNLRELIQNVVESTKYLNTAKPNSYHIEIDEHIPHTLVGDDIKVSQILMNLLSNASKFTHNGFITIEVEREADEGENICINFSIQDSGIGISKERQQDIFTEFSQTRSSYKHQGTGLGLPIVKRLLELLGSSIVLESEPNKGTHVCFNLCFEKARRANRNISNNLEPVPSIQGKKVLVVDDNTINLLVTEKMLERQGAHVFVASSGKVGIEMAQTLQLDLILMDINMPEMNGFEVAEIIRSFDSNVPIVALTAVEKEKLILKNGSSLFDDFIIKPYKPEQFINMISNFVNVEVY